MLRSLKILLAVSHDEVWASRDSGLWHFQAGAWANEPVDPGRSQSAPVSMTLGHDGTVWAAGEAGVAYRRGGRWTIADPSAASAVAVDEGGTVWVAGNGRTAGIPVWTLRFKGTAWAKEAIELCPIEAGDTPSLAIDRTGALWLGVHLGWWPGGLARFDGRSWTKVTDPGGAEIVGATVLGADAGGDVWVAAQLPFVPSPSAPDQTGPALDRVGRFDGTAWTFVATPPDYWSNGWGGDTLLAPDGTPWVSTSRGPSRYDGQNWALGYPDDFSGASSALGLSYAVAPDGTVFGRLADTVVRFPPPPRSR